MESIRIKTKWTFIVIIILKKAFLNLQTDVFNYLFDGEVKENIKWFN